MYMVNFFIVTGYFHCANNEPKDQFLQPKDTFLELDGGQNWDFLIQLRQNILRKK